MLPVAGAFTQESRAKEAGFMVGDRILAVNGRDVRSITDFIPLVQMSADTPMAIDVDRGGERLVLSVTPERVEQKTPFGPISMGQIGLRFNADSSLQRFEQLGFVQSIVAGVEECGAIMRQTFTFLSRLFTGRENLDQMNGPIGIANITGQVAQNGLDNLIWLTAVLSFSIGLVNLFPIPVLDGGHLMFYLLEAVRRRPMNERAQEFGYRIGFGLIMALLVVVSFNDVRKLFSLLTG
jgi:regulator of sigma E protease